MRYRILAACLLSGLLIALGSGQTPAPQAPAAEPASPAAPAAPHPRHMAMHPMPAMPVEGMPMGKWWKNAEIVKELQLSDDQLQRLEKTFQDSRLHLIDLHAALQKQEAQLEPLIESDNPDESQVDAQIDRIASARAELEKTHTRMLLDVRRVLSAEQWKKLQTMPGNFGPMHPMGADFPARTPAPFKLSEPAK